MSLGRKKKSVTYADESFCLYSNSRSLSPEAEELPLLGLSSFSPLLLDVLVPHALCLSPCSISFSSTYAHPSVPLVSMPGEHLDRNYFWRQLGCRLSVFTHWCLNDFLKFVDMNFLTHFPWENIYMLLNGPSLLLSCFHCDLQNITGNKIIIIVITNPNVCLNWSLGDKLWKPGALTSEYSMRTCVWHSRPTQRD